MRTNNGYFDFLSTRFWATAKANSLSVGSDNVANALLSLNKSLENYSELFGNFKN